MSTTREQPWAVPFLVEESEARAAFHNWTATQWRNKAFALHSLRSEHLPFYVFEGRVQGRFTGVLTYTDTTYYTDRNGKRQSRLSYRYYAREDIPFVARQPTGASTPEAFVYAGFQHRAECVEGAVRGRAALAHVVRLNEARSPPFTGIGAFEMKPSFAYARVDERLRAVARAEAEHELQYGNARALTYRYRGGGGLTYKPKWDDLIRKIDTPGVACPATDWRAPYSYHVENVAYELAGARLHDRGVVLLPVWIVEYAFEGEVYNCFVGGVDARVRGLTHMVTQDARQVGGASGFTAGLGVAICLQWGSLIGAPGAGAVDFASLAVLSLGGAAIGAWFGHGRAVERQASWERAGHQRSRHAQANRAWQTQPFWQEQVRRVLRQQQQEQQQQQQQYQQHQQQRRPHSQAEQHPGERQQSDWRSMDDYALLGLSRTPTPTRAAISAAFRREAMKYHPDHNQRLAASELAEYSERTKRISEVYGRLRRGNANDVLDRIRNAR